MGAGYLDGKLYIQFAPANVVVWDLAADRVVDTLAVPADIMGGLTGADDLGALFASTLAGNILEIGPATGDVLATYATGLGPLAGGLAYHNGTLLAANTGGTPAWAYRIDPSDGTVLGQVDLGGVGGGSLAAANVGGLAGDVTHTFVGMRRFQIGWHDLIEGADFGMVQAASVSGGLFYDLNGDGVQDGGEVGLNGWAVELIDTASQERIATAITDDIDLDDNGTIDPMTERGRYALTAVPGVYELRLVVADGYLQTAPAGGAHVVTLASGDNALGLDFAAHNPAVLASVSGQVFEDRNFDGLRDGGEDGLDGRTVALVDMTTGHVVAQIVTGSIDLDGSGTIDPTTEAGLFTVDGITPGEHALRLIDETPWIETTPGAPAILALAGGESLEGFVLAAARKSTIRGQVFQDLNGNHERDADEAGINGRTIELVDPATGLVIATAESGNRDGNGDGWIDPLAEVGWYAFCVEPGSYRVRQVLPEHRVQTTPIADAYAFTLSYGADADAAHFGSSRPGHIRGWLFGDRDGNGSLYFLEEGVDGVTIDLIDNVSGQVIRTTVTAAGDFDGDGEIHPAFERGVFTFLDTPPGDYTFDVHLPDGWALTSGTDLVLPAEAEPQVTIGVAIPARIAGQIFDDANANGRRDATEPGLNGQTVELVDQASGAVVATAVTSQVDLNGDESIDPVTETGLYAFEDLSAAQYEVRLVVNGPWQQSSPTTGQRIFTTVSNGAAGITFYEIDPASGVLCNVFDGPPSPHQFFFQGMAAGPDGFYCLDSTGLGAPTDLHEIDPDDGTIRQTQVLPAVPGASVIGAAALDGHIWILYTSNELRRWNQTNEVFDAAFTFDRMLTALAADNDAGLLYAAAEGNAILAIDPTSGAVVGEIALGEEIAYVAGLAFANGELLVAPHIEYSNTIYRVDPATGDVIDRFAMWNGSLSGLSGDGFVGGPATSRRILLLWRDDADGQDFGLKSAPLLGDVNGDGQIDAADIDDLFAHLGDPVPNQYDLDGDGDVDNADVDTLIHDILGTEYGDLNLDGAVDIADLVILRSGYGGVGGWGDGDIDGDGLIDLADLAILRTTFGFLA